MKLFIVIMILVIYVVCKKNSFNSLQKSIKHGESEIGIQMAKRRDCLDDALQIAKLSYEKEVEGIERLTAGDKLERLAFLGQKYPDLQYTNGYQQALGQAMELDRDITAARQILNGNIREYNTAITSFPGSLLASVFGYKEEKFLDEENGAQNRQLNKSEIDFNQY